MRYLCPAPKFHDWSDDQPDVAGGLPPLRFCPQHTDMIERTTGRRPPEDALAGIEPNKEETKN